MSKYKDQNDNELIYLVSDNSEEAKNIIFEKYKPLIEMKAKKLNSIAESRGYDFNDLVQEGMIGLSEAINSFEEQRDVQFYTFANLCIDRQIATFIRNISRDKHKVLNDSISFESSTNTAGRPLTDIILDDKNIDTQEIYVRLEQEKDLIEKINKLLSDKEKEVFDLRIQGFSYKEIANLLNTSIKTVDNTIVRIKNKIQDQLIVKN